MQKLTLKLCLPGLLLVLLLAACDEPQEGCLDVEATNFDVTADRACDDCCTSPKLVLTVSQVFDTLVWIPDSAYQNDLGQWFRIRNSAFYLSDFELVKSGEVLEVEDTLRLKIFGANVGDTLNRTLKNDFVLARRTSVDFTVGAFRPSGTFEEVRLRLGLNAQSNAVIPGSVSSSHPLYRQADSLWLGRDNGFAWLMLAIRRDTAAATPTDTLRFTAADLGGQPLTLTGTGTFKHEVGYNFKIKLRINYDVLLSGVDLQNTSPNQWKSKIVANLPAALEVLE